MQISPSFGKVAGMMKAPSSFAAVLMLVLPSFLLSSPLLAQQPNAAELQAAIQRLGVVGSVLYVAAHPDDENSRLMAYLVGARGLTTTYLSLTRGDGGQNLIGTEQDELLGLLRTHELLAARQRDGAEQLFTRARDLGYTTRADEALAIWGHDAVLGDVVQAIRRVKPDVIVTRFNTLPPNHGHHTASAILAAEAFTAAADPARYPEQLARFGAWQTPRLLHNVPMFNVAPNTDLSQYMKLDVGGYDPLRGKSWPEIAAESRSQHKSQGFGVTAERGPSLEYFQWLAGSKPRTDPLDGLDLTWKRFAGGEKIQKTADVALAAFEPRHPDKAIPALWQLHALLSALPDENPWKIRKLHETESALLACAGLVLDARAAAATANPGGRLAVELVAVNRSAIPAKLLAVRLADGVTEVNAALTLNQPVVRKKTMEISSDAPITTPYWLRAPADGGLDNVPELALRGLPVAPPPLQAEFLLELGGHKLAVVRPVRHVWNDPIKGEQSRLVEVAPPQTQTLDRPVVVVPNGQTALVTSHDSTGQQLEMGQARLSAGWHFTRQPGTGADTVLAIGAAPGVTTPGELRLGWNERHIAYDHVPPLTVRQPSVAKLVPVTLALGGKKLGYVPGPGDRVAESLQAVGYDVTLLPPEKLATEPLAPFDAILVGIRAFNQAPELAGQRAKLLKYVENGGRLVVQYQTNTKLAPLMVDIGPFPLEIGRERVTDENAEMTPLDPNEPLLRTPNQLTAADFAGWVQERGLYFAQKWDPRYRAVFAMHDQDEAPLQGGLLVAKLGKGTFVYTGLAFFRQLPAGVPGAYRLLANLLAL